MSTPGSCGDDDAHSRQSRNVEARSDLAVLPSCKLFGWLMLDVRARPPTVNYLISGLQRAIP
jgi:hypothetical protein